MTERSTDTYLLHDDPQLPAFARYLKALESDNMISEDELLAAQLYFEQHPEARYLVSNLDDSEQQRHRAVKAVRMRLHIDQGGRPEAGSAAVTTLKQELTSMLRKLESSFIVSNYKIDRTLGECMMKSNYRAKAKSSSSYHVGGNVRYCHVVPIRDLEYFHSYEFLAAFKSHYFLVKFAESETPFNDGEDWKECDAVNCSIQYLGAEEVPKYKVKCGIGKIGPAVTEDGRYLEGKVLSNSLQYGGNVSFGAWPTWTGFRKPNHGDPWVATDVVYLTVFFQPAA